MPGGTNYAKCADGKTVVLHYSFKTPNLEKNSRVVNLIDSNGVPKKNEFFYCGTTEPKEEDAKEDFWNHSDIDSETNWTKRFCDSIRYLDAEGTESDVEFAKLQKL